MLDIDNEIKNNNSNKYDNESNGDDENDDNNDNNDSDKIILIKNNEKDDNNSNDNIKLTFLKLKVAEAGDQQKRNLTTVVSTPTGRTHLIPFFSSKTMKEMDKRRALQWLFFVERDFLYFLFS